MLKKLFPFLGKAEALEQENQKLQAQIQELELARSSVEAQLQDAQGDQQALTTLTQQLEGLQRENEDLNQKIAEKEQARQGLEADLNNLRLSSQETESSQVAALSQELLQTKTTLETLEQKLADAEAQVAQVAQLNEQLDLQKSELGSLNQKNLQLQMQNRELNNQLQTMQQQTPVKKAGGDDSRKGKAKILVVDDSMTTRMLVKNILQSSGFEVFLAKDGLEGKDELIKHTPDMVITDIEMPKMDGFELTRWIKKEPMYQATPVILVTSLADDEFRGRGTEAGADSFITKSNFNQETFMKVIQKFL